MEAFYILITIGAAFVAVTALTEFMQEWRIYPRGNTWLGKISYWSTIIGLVLLAAGMVYSVYLLAHGMWSGIMILVFLSAILFILVKVAEYIHDKVSSKGWMEACNATAYLGMNFGVIIYAVSGILCVFLLSGI